MIAIPYGATDLAQADSVSRTAAELRDGDVHVWSVDLSEGDQQWREVLPMLSKLERDRASRFRIDVDRRRFVVAHACLRKVLGAYCETGPADIEFQYGVHGKPALGSRHAHSGVQFNLSHAEDVALCAIVRGFSVGVDVERVRGDVDAVRIAAQFFSATEQRMVEESRDPHDTFARIWVRKEAYVKATGEGIGADLQSFSVTPGAKSDIGFVGEPQQGRWVAQEVAVAAGYAAAIVTDSAAFLRECGAFPWSERPRL